MTMKLWILGVLVMILIGCGNWAFDSEERFTILAGVGLEYRDKHNTPTTILIDDSFKYVLGLTEMSIKIGGASAVGGAYYTGDHPKFGKFEIHFVENRVRNITTFNKQFKTDQRIGIGSTLDEMIDRYGTPDSWHEFDYTYANYIDRRIAFGYDTEIATDTIACVQVY